MKPNMPGQKITARSSLQKGLRLLNEVLADRGRSSLSQISARIGMPLATAHRMAVTLVEEGYLTRVRKGHFLAGSMMGGVPLPPISKLAAYLRPQLARRAKSFGAFAHFGMLEEEMVTYYVKEGPGDRDLFSEEDMQLEAYCTGMGKILLAAMPPAAFEAYLDNGPFVALTERTITDAARLRLEIEDARNSGVAFDRYEIRDDVFCVAVPLISDRKIAVGGISLSFVGSAPDTLKLRRAIRSLRTIAQNASAQLNEIAPALNARAGDK